MDKHTQKTERMRQEILAMDEGEGAGPGAPETIEPVHGAAESSPTTWTNGAGTDGPRDTGADDAHLDLAGTAAVPTRRGIRLLARPFGLLRERFTRSP